MGAQALRPHARHYIIKQVVVVFINETVVVDVSQVFATSARQADQAVKVITEQHDISQVDNGLSPSNSQGEIFPIDSDPNLPQNLFFWLTRSERSLQPEGYKE